MGKFKALSLIALLALAACGGSSTPPVNSTPGAPHEQPDCPNRDDSSTACR